MPNDTTLIQLSASPNHKTPKITVPKTPIPVHTVYEILRGIVLSDAFKNITLKHIAPITTTDGANFEKFAVYLRPTAQTISQIPATNKQIQLFILVLFNRRIYFFKAYFILKISID